MLDAATTTAMVQTLIDDFGDVLGGAVPIVIGVLGILIGLTFVIKFIKKHIGRAR